MTTKTENAQKQKYAQWTRTDQGDGATECLRIVKLDSGETFSCSDLDGEEYPYLIQITTGPDLGDDFGGLYDLDGDQLNLSNVSWELVPLAELPPEVIEQIESGWGSGSSVVTRDE